mmetsp:Transcript_13428/g.18360  ORF Transcript_13428/g.18360 Transcript_13428/m.18360 type:complete len:86 (-) Transcript_13428:1649-1906(-)
MLILLKASLCHTFNKFFIMSAKLDNPYMRGQEAHFLKSCQSILNASLSFLKSAEILQNDTVVSFAIQIFWMVHREKSTAQINRSF